MSVMTDFNAEENEAYSSIIRNSYDDADLVELTHVMIDIEAERVYKGTANLIDWMLENFEPVAVEAALMRHALDVHNAWCEGCEVCERD